MARIWRFAMRFVSGRLEKHLRVPFLHTLYPRVFCFRSVYGIFSKLVYIVYNIGLYFLFYFVFLFYNQDSETW
jgi:hypothetical protein